MRRQGPKGPPSLWSPHHLGVSTGHPSFVSISPHAPYPPGFRNPGLHPSRIPHLEVPIVPGLHDPGVPPYVPDRQNPGTGASAVARTARAHSPLPGARWARTLVAVRDTRRRACSRGPRGSWPGLLSLQRRLPRPPPGTWRAAPPGPLRPTARPGLSHNPCRRASLAASPTPAALPAPWKVWASAGCPGSVEGRRGARLRLLCRDAEVTPPARRCSWKVQVAL